MVANLWLEFSITRGRESRQKIGPDKHQVPTWSCLLQTGSGWTWCFMFVFFLQLFLIVCVQRNGGRRCILFDDASWWSRVPLPNILQNHNIHLLLSCDRPRHAHWKLCWMFQNNKVFKCDTQTLHFKPRHKHCMVCLARRWRVRSLVPLAGKILKSRTRNQLVRSLVPLAGKILKWKTRALVKF